jgi:protease-4
MKHHRWLAALAALSLSACVFDFGSFSRTDPLQEKTVLGEDGVKLAMIEIDGLITSRPDSSPFGFARPSPVARVREALDLAKEDSKVAGLILRVRSPGGTVSASETIYHMLNTWKEETGRPVVAYFQGLATSGGYYVAMAADEIVAHPTSVTGSIGVIMPGINLAGLMERFGVQDQTFTSGAFKDSGSPLRPMRPDERAYLDAVVAALYDRFREVVGIGRPGLDDEAIAKLADGRIFTGGQALEVGLVDRVGHLDVAVAALEQRVGATQSRVVIYHRPGEFRTNVYTRGQSAPLQVVNVDVLSLDLQQLEAGFYYLWPLATRGR